MPRPAVKLHTTLAQFEAAWKLVNSARNRSTVVRIDVAALKALLMDHSLLCGKVDIDDFKPRGETS